MNDAAPLERSMDEHFLAEFQARRWPLERWHHRDHVKLAYLYLMRYGLDGASLRFPRDIRAHNAVHHIPERIDSGYHETMTQAWLRLVYLALCEYGPAATADEFTDQHPELLEKKMLRLFYSRERFMCEQAKREFIEPDLAPLPKPRRNWQPGPAGTSSTE